MSSHSQPRRGRLGITLIEMLVVIVLIGILAGISASRLDWSRYRADSIGRGLMAGLSAAQRTAVSLQNDVRIIPLGTDRLQVHEDTDNDGSIDGGERITMLTLDHGYRFGKGSMSNTPSPEDPTDLFGVTVIFRRDGTASRSGTYYIASPIPADASTCKYCRAVAVARATGRTVSYSYATGAWVRAN
jgi:prepilin-type N-terminal cleavage/methylation domain-containing protein